MDEIPELEFTSITVEYDIRRDAWIFKGADGGYLAVSREFLPNIDPEYVKFYIKEHTGIDVPDSILKYLAHNIPRDGVRYMQFPIPPKIEKVVWQTEWDDDYCDCNCCDH